MDFQSIGKWLVGTGVVIALIGLALQILSRIPLIGRLPGDILIKREHFSFYFPLTTCILISLAVMLISRFIGHK